MWVTWVAINAVHRLSVVGTLLALRVYGFFKVKCLCIKIMFNMIVFQRLCDVRVY